MVGDGLVGGRGAAADPCCTLLPRILLDRIGLNNIIDVQMYRHFATRGLIELSLPRRILMF